MFHTVDKCSVVDIPVAPYEDAIVVFRFVVQKLADVNVSVYELETVAVLAVVLKVSLVETQEVGFVDEETITVVQVVAGLTEVDSSCAFEEKQLTVQLYLLGCHLL
jgi:hypothetical protein